MHRRFLVVAGLALLVSCGGSDSGGPSGQNGSLAFNYSGMVSGSYSATGAPPASSSQNTTTTWSVGMKDEPNQSLVVASNADRAGGRFDIILLQIDRLVAGSSTVDVDCDPEFQDACTGLLVLLGISQTTGETQFFCGLITGQIAITSISSSRAQGTFSGSGFCIDENNTEGTFNVSGGTFDVALVANLPS